MEEKSVILTNVHFLSLVLKESDKIQRACCMPACC